MFHLRALSDRPEEAIRIAADHAPYLAKLQSIEVDLSNPDQVITDAHAMCAAVSEQPDQVMSQLRQAKARAHLAIAANDLSGRADLSATTTAITDFADCAVQAALAAALQERDLKVAGLFVVALGKMGAHELNYSSDIDIAAFFDPDLFNGGAREPATAAAWTIQQAARTLSDRTPDGYVFRTDLRLRPDPSSTPVAVSTRRADLYYESVGQNWERMVWIKGRPSAGDDAAAARFLKAMSPFVWRRHLDYWAISDVHAIKDMINAKAGDKSLHDVAADLKLGPGGIREIEFFVQTQQIILGGRHPDLRVRGTLDGLDQLIALGVVQPDAAQELAQAYDVLRMVEHRVQMLNDEQTHTLPSFETRRAGVAALCGYSELDTFDSDLIAVRKCVHAHYQALFADELQKRKRAVDGNLVFTGVDDDPATVTTLETMGFRSAPDVIERVRQWHRGRTPATRTLRGRELLTAILPDLLTAMGQTGEADEAFRRFSRFFEGLRSGVQVLAMLVAEPVLMQDLVTTLAIAPRIADILARRPGLLEALVSVTDRKLDPDLSPDMDFETRMNAVRHWQGEQAFLIGHQLLHGQIKARDAAADWTRLADTCVTLMAQAAEMETARRFGPAPGSWSIIGLGKLGGREMTAGSDLDLLVIYDAQGAEGAQTWFTKFTQRLITAISAETSEGSLYETDMRLRPSGRAGPVATSLSAFESYHQTSAWTWEHMALTRLRPIVGDTGLGAQVQAIAERMLQSRDPVQRTTDILDMRARLYREKAPQGPWDLKMRQGGLLDLEFITQHAILTAGTPQPLKPELVEAQAQLLATGIWPPDVYDSLARSFELLQALQQVQRMANDDIAGETELSMALKERLCRASGCDRFEALEQKLEQTCAGVFEVFCRNIGVPATET
ncbi:MAG: bifunctional [glutamine synthetase] adenylyltransferase/[glutamine synthetase]-adenylyl-L-tyrosine phosphorylase [Pseudomonadota bacterium]